MTDHVIGTCDSSGTFSNILHVITHHGPHVDTGLLYNLGRDVGHHGADVGRIVGYIRFLYIRP